jgi:uncharacterized protein YneF (UPF0154 family)
VDAVDGQTIIIVVIIVLVVLFVLGYFFARQDARLSSGLDPNEPRETPSA